MRLNHNRRPGENQDSKLHCGTVCTPGWAERFPDCPVLRRKTRADWIGWDSGYRFLFVIPYPSPAVLLGPMLEIVKRCDEFFLSTRTDLDGLEYKGFRISSLANKVPGILAVSSFPEIEQHQKNRLIAFPCLSRKPWALTWFAAVLIELDSE